MRPLQRSRGSASGTDLTVSHCPARHEAGALVDDTFERVASQRGSEPGSIESVGVAARPLHLRMSVIRFTCKTNGRIGDTT